jgi:hypothetical protein
MDDGNGRDIPAIFFSGMRGRPHRAHRVDDIG